jgi:hypothetical protein
MFKKFLARGTKAKAITIAVCALVIIGIAAVIMVIAHQRSGQTTSDGKLSLVLSSTSDQLYIPKEGSIKKEYAATVVNGKKTDIKWTVTKDGTPMEKDKTVDGVSYKVSAGKVTLTADSDASNSTVNITAQIGEVSASCVLR